MQLCSIHPFDPGLAGALVEAIRTGNPAVGIPAIDGTRWLADRMRAASEAMPMAATGRESAANVVSHAFAQTFAAAQPSFVFDGLSLTSVEATIDRGVGMLLRPPSRLFGEAGLDAAVARAMPIRLDPGAGMMGGAFMPPHLAPRLVESLRDREERWVRRLHGAGYDAIGTYGLLVEMATWAAGNGLGLYEALDAVVPGIAAANPPGASLVVVDRGRMDRDTAKRLESMLKPKKRGLIARITGNGAARREDPIR